MKPIPLTETQMAELFRLRSENAAMKEQVAHLEEHSTHMATKENATISDLSKYVSTLEETIAQQAEAILMKDKALKHIASRVKANGFITTINYCRYC